MSIRACRVLAVEGTRNSGKTTLALALTAHYRALGIDAAHVGDAACDNPLLTDDDATSSAACDLSAELDVLGTIISGQIRAARRHRLLVVERTAASVIAHGRVALPEDERDVDVWTAAEVLCRSWKPYDLVVCVDEQNLIDPRIGPHWEMPGPRLPSGTIVGVLQEARYPLVHLPAGLSLRQRISWVSRRANRRGLLREPSPPA